MDCNARIQGVLKHSSVNGPGVRYVIFMQGCPHGCPACQNPETHDPDAGTEMPVSEILNEILEDRYIDGVTLSGGDPFMQPLPSALIAGKCKEAGLNVWAYTGWTFEELTGIEEPLIKPPDGAAEVLGNLDVLVDGRYVDSLHVGDDEKQEYMWVGSKNQRLIDVPRSLAEHRAVTVDDKA